MPGTLTALEVLISSHDSYVQVSDLDLQGPEKPGHHFIQQPRKIAGGTRGVILILGCALSLDLCKPLINALHVSRLQVGHWSPWPRLGLGLIVRRRLLVLPLWRRFQKRYEQNIDITDDDLNSFAGWGSGRRTHPILERQVLDIELDDLENIARVADALVEHLENQKNMVKALQRSLSL